MRSDPRIGIINPDGSRDWPETTIDGQTYSRPVNEVGLGESHFAVFIGGIFTDAQREELLALIRVTRPAKEKDGSE